MLKWRVAHKDSDNLSKPPHCVDIACWIDGAKQQMKQSTLVNAWMRHDLEYFPCASPVVDVPSVVNVLMGEDVTNSSGLFSRSSSFFGRPFFLAAAKFGQ